MAAVQVGILMLWLLPLAAVGGGVYLGLLTDHDINWYLSTLIAGTALAIGVLAATGVALSFLAFAGYSFI